MKKIKWIISPFLVVMIAVLTVCGYFYDCVIYFTTIVLHELAHAEVGSRLGYTLDGFKLMPYGASLTGQFEGISPHDEIIIALAGPLFNASLSVIFTALWWILPELYSFTERLVLANIFTAIFNLLPVFPLDGGRITLAAMSIKMPRQNAYKRLRMVGYFVSPLFAALFVMLFVCMGEVNISFALISGFIFFSTIFKDKNSAYRRIYGMAYFSERLKRGLKISKIMVADDSTLISLDKMLNSNYFTEFTVVDEKLSVVAQITETKLESLLKQYPPLTKISEIVDKIGDEKSVR